MNLSHTSINQLTVGFHSGGEWLLVAEGHMSAISIFIYSRYRGDYCLHSVVLSYLFVALKSDAQLN